MSTVVITAGSDETHCLRVRGEVCLLDCTVWSRCWLGGKQNREEEEEEWRAEAKRKRGRWVPGGAERLESYDWFPGTTQPCALGKTSGGGGRRQVRNWANNYGVGTFWQVQASCQLSPVRLTVATFHKNTKQKTGPLCLSQQAPLHRKLLPLYAPISNTPPPFIGFTGCGTSVLFMVFYRQKLFSPNKRYAHVPPHPHISEGFEY